MITTGFGVTLCTATGVSRKWVMGKDGIKRWADNNKPIVKDTKK